MTKEKAEEIDKKLEADKKESDANHGLGVMVEVIQRRFEGGPVEGFDLGEGQGKG